MNIPAPSQKPRRIPFPNDVSVLPGEKIVKVAHFHWGIYWKGLVVLAFALLLMTQVVNLGIFMIVVAALMLGASYLTKHYLLLILTNKRVLLRTGIIRMDTVQLPIERIESAELERTIPGLIMGYASVVLTGTGSRIMAVPYVDQPQVFRRLADEVIYTETHKDQSKESSTGLSSGGLSGDAGN